MTGTGMTSHLATCPGRIQRIAEAYGNDESVQALYHLLVRDHYDPGFWLHLEMNGSATLNELDGYLRAIWLECCDHLSKFTRGGWGPGVPMSHAASRVFDHLTEVTHLYDFGTTSQTVIRLVGGREGKPLALRPIVLMARNDLPEATCQECSGRATHYCSECAIERDLPGLLCDKHVKEHSCDNYRGPIPLVNSPRLGMCGYEGPADPPY